MRFGSSTLKAVLQGSFDWNYLIDMFYNGVRVLTNVPIQNVNLNDDATALVQYSGSFEVAYQDDFFASIAPKAIGDILSPFGTQIALSVIVSDGAGFSERVPLMQYLLSETPEILAQLFLFQGRTLSKGDLVDINIKDLSYGIQRDQFNAPGAPLSLVSVYSEVQRLSGLPLTKLTAVPDGAIPNTVAYQQDKLQACYDLAGALDAVIAMQPDGTVGMRPNVWPSPVDTLAGGDGGTLVSVGRAMANDTVYNAVVIQTTDPTLGTVVLATLELTSGPLRTTNPDGSLSPYRRVPYFYSSPFITTQAQAAAYAPTLLARVSTLRSVVVKLTEIFNPLRDLGDVITVNRMSQGVVTETFTGRVQQISRSNAGTQTTTIAVFQ